MSIYVSGGNWEDTDDMILDFLARTEDVLANRAALIEAVGISWPSIYKRIQSLRRRGYIKRHTGERRFWPPHVRAHGLEPIKHPRKPHE